MRTLQVFSSVHCHLEKAEIKHTSQPTQVYGILSFLTGKALLCYLQQGMYLAQVAAT